MPRALRENSSLSARRLGGAAVFAGIRVAGIHGRLRRDAEAYSHAGWRLVLLLCAVYVAGTLALIAVCR